MLKAVLILLSLHSALSFEVSLAFGSLNKLQSYDFNLDFAFNHVLVNEGQIKCHDDLGCRILDQVSYFDVYNYTVYSYRLALVNFILFDESESDFRTLEIETRLGNYPHNILGLNPYSIIAEPLNMKSLVVDLSNKRVKLSSGESGANLSLFVENEKTVYYMDAILRYSSNIDNQEPLFHTNTANICFHDRDVTAPHPFFLAGSASHIDYWFGFANNYGKYKDDILNFEYSITLQDPSPAFKLIYDNQIFKLYKDPFAYYLSKFYQSCDLFLGDLAVLRGGIKIILEQDAHSKNLIAKIQTTQNRYILKPSFHFYYVLYTLIMFALVLTALVYLKQKYAREEQAGVDKALPIIEMEFEKGYT